MFEWIENNQQYIYSEIKTKKNPENSIVKNTPKCVDHIEKRTFLEKKTKKKQNWN